MTGALELTAGQVNTYNFQSASVRELIDRTRISELLPALGGPEVKRGRCPAWFRGGDSDSLSVNDRFGSWHDFKTGQHGGILDLIELALGCSRREAVKWLGDHHGVSLGGWRTPTDAHAWRQRSQRVKAAVGELEAFRRSLGSFLRAIRNTLWDSCNDLERWADSQSGFSEDPRWEEFARVPSRRRLGDSVDRYITEVGQMGARELIALRSRIVGGAACH